MVIGSAILYVASTCINKYFDWLANRGGAKGGGLGGISPTLTSVEKLCQKDYNLFLFHFATTILIFWECVIHHWKGVIKTIPTVYYKPPNSKNFNW
jgi:hypothetical protein